MRKRLKVRGILAGVIFLVVAGWASAAGQVVDRMLAIVDGRVVTAEDLRRYQALARFFNEQDVPETQAELLNRVIESVLVRAQVARVPGIRATDREIDEFLARFSLPDHVDFPLSAAALREAARERIENQRYFLIRFPQRVTDEEIVEYYRNVYAPEAEARGLTPSLDEVEDVIELLVGREKTQQDAILWARTLVQRSRVEVVE